MNIKDMVINENMAMFDHYFDGALWYRVEWIEKDGIEKNGSYGKDREFLFPVPIEDIGTATFKNEEKALLMMRYIRKHLELTSSSN